MVQGLVAAAVPVAARRPGARQVSGRLWREDRRRLQVPRRWQGAAEISAPVHRGGAMRPVGALLGAVILASTMCVAAAFAEPAFQSFLESLWPQAQALG